MVHIDHGLDRGPGVNWLMILDFLLFEHRFVLQGLMMLLFRARMYGLRLGDEEIRGVPERLVDVGVVGVVNDEVGKLVHRVEVLDLNSPLLRSLLLLIFELVMLLKAMSGIRVAVAVPRAVSPSLASPPPLLGIACIRSQVLPA